MEEVGTNSKFLVTEFRVSVILGIDLQTCAGDRGNKDDSHGGMDARNHQEQRDRINHAPLILGETFFRLCGRDPFGRWSSRMCCKQMGWFADKCWSFATRGSDGTLTRMGIDMRRPVRKPHALSDVVASAKHQELMANHLDLHRKSLHFCRSVREKLRLEEWWCTTVLSSDSVQASKSSVPTKLPLLEAKKT